MSKNPVLADCEGSIFLPRILSFQKDFPEIFESTEILLSGPEFLVYSLAGQKEPFTTLPEPRFQKAYWNSELLLKHGINPHILPSFAPITARQGFLSKDFLAELGLSESAEIPLFCCGPDFVSALIGTNTLSPGKICDRSGSSEGINLCVGGIAAGDAAQTIGGIAADDASDGVQVRTLPSVKTPLWNKSVIIPKSGSILDELKENSQWKDAPFNEFFKNTLESNDEKSISAINEVLRNVNDAYRTILSIRDTLGAETKSPAKSATNNAQKSALPIVCTGGQTKSKIWMQYKSSFLGQSLSVTNCPDSELAGCAVTALSALNGENDLKKISSQIVKIEKTYNPF